MTTPAHFGVRDRSPEHLAVQHLAGAKRSYQVMAQAYRAIFDRFGLRYRAVAADSGAIGGDVLKEPGDRLPPARRHRLLPEATTRPTWRRPRPYRPGARGPRSARQALARTPTPGKSTCADVAELLLAMPLQATVKSLVLATDEN